MRKAEEMERHYGRFSLPRHWVHDNLDKAVRVFALAQFVPIAASPSASGESINYLGFSPLFPEAGGDPPIYVMRIDYDGKENPCAVCFDLKA